MFDNIITYIHIINRSMFFGAIRKVICIATAYTLSGYCLYTKLKKKNENGHTFPLLIMKNVSPRAPCLIMQSPALQKVYRKIRYIVQCKIEKLYIIEFFSCFIFYLFQNVRYLYKGFFGQVFENRNAENNAITNV